MPRVFLFCLLLLPIAAFPQIPLGIGEWRTHVPYRNATSLTDAGDRIYVSANVFFFSFDKETNSLQRYDKVTGLSDVGVSFVEFNPFNSTLLIAYENTNIDLIRGNDIINISDIKRKQIVGEKKINSVFFLDNLAYLSCSFGIIVLDMDKLEIKDTYRIGTDGANKQVYNVTADDSFIYAATEEGLKIADKNSANLANYAEWSMAQGLSTGVSRHVVKFNNDIIANVQDTLFRKNGAAWNYYYSQPDWKIENLSVSGNTLLLCESSDSLSYTGRLGIFENGVCCTYLDQSPVRNPLDALIDTTGTLWIADFLQGLLRREDNSFSDPIYPNGPATIRVQNLAASDSKVWVMPGGADPAWNHLFNSDGYFKFDDNWWNTYNQYSGIPELEDLLSLYEVAVHPTGNPAYIGTFWGGLLEVNNNDYTLYDTSNSSLQKAVGDPSRIKVTGLAFDSEQNLWVTNYNTVRSLSVRKTDGTWKSFQPVPIIEGGLVSQIIVDDYDQKWFIIPKGSSRGIMVFDNGATIDATNDGDRFIHLKSGGNGNLHTSDVFCLANDLSGEIWVGTAEGISVFYCPGSIFDGCDAQRIIVTQNGVVGYLLETERVTTIAVDGANRKWVGTLNGVFVLSPDGTTQVEYFTEENSPLLSNNITDIAIDGITGEVFIGTDKGLVSYRGEAIAGTEEHSDVLVFPNPVRENYEGPIAIKGLANDANVKITDVNGMLFYETTALGGQAVWDGKNYEGSRAKTGVYFVFSSNEDGSSKQVAKLLIIN